VSQRPHDNMPALVLSRGIRMEGSDLSTRHVLATGPGSDDRVGKAYMWPQGYRCCDKVGNRHQFVRLKKHKLAAHRNLRRVLRNDDAAN
jgi:hypothetical protein